jgi:REP element-mobilizing transposase RayT
MSRPLRLHVPGLLHHVFARGNEKASIFTDDQDYASFLELLAEALPRFGGRCVAYCLLWNHYHLLLVPNEHRVSRLLQQLNSAYCQRFNRRHNRVGHVLQGRFGCRIVEDGAYARTVLRYLALNPVAAGRAAKPEDWPWSSYRFALGLEEVRDSLSLQDVWAAFGTSDGAVGRERLAAFVGAGHQDAFTNPLLHGSTRLAKRLAAHLEPYQTTRDYVHAARFAARPSLGSLLEGCVDRKALEDAAHAAFHQHAYTLAEIAAVVSRDPSVVSRWIRQSKLRQSANPCGCHPPTTSLQETRSDPSVGHAAENQRIAEALGHPM